MRNLNDLLSAANNVKSNSDFLNTSIPLVAHDAIKNNIFDYEEIISLALADSVNDENQDAVNEFSNRFNDLVCDMDYNDTESMEESSSRVYLGWSERDQSLPKLSDYVKQVKSFIESKGE